MCMFVIHPGTSTTPSQEETYSLMAKKEILYKEGDGSVLKSNSGHMLEL